MSSSPFHSPLSSTGPASERNDVKLSMRPLWSTRTISTLYLSNSRGQMALSTCASTKSLRSSKLSSASPVPEVRNNIVQQKCEARRSDVQPIRTGVPKNMVISFSGNRSSSAAALRKHCWRDIGCKPMATPKCRKKHLKKAQTQQFTISIGVRSHQDELVQATTAGGSPVGLRQGVRVRLPARVLGGDHHVLQERGELHPEVHLVELEEPVLPPARTRKCNYNTHSKHNRCKGKCLPIEIYGVGLGLLGLGEHATRELVGGARDLAHGLQDLAVQGQHGGGLLQPLRGARRQR